jgi:hypothetical protein
MVISNNISKVLSLLEKYYLEKTDFQLNGNSYDMIMVTPEQSNIESNKWIISAKYFDNSEKPNLISDILEYFQRNLGPTDYLSVSSLIVLNSSLAFIQNIKFMFPFNNPVFELSNISIGGVDIDHAYIIHSRKLEKLEVEKEVYVNHKIEGSIKIRPISLDRQWNLKCYTERGINQLHSANVNDFFTGNRMSKNRDEEWQSQGFIRFIFFDDILDVF